MDWPIDWDKHERSSDNIGKLDLGDNVYVLWRIPGKHPRALARGIVSWRTPDGEEEDATFLQDELDLRCWLTANGYLTNGS